MESTAIPPEGLPAKKDERLETVTAQFWVEDLTQLKQLVSRRNREQIAYMRRLALHIGTMMLSASQGMPVMTNKSGIVGMYTVEELAEELLPQLAAVIQNFERLGIPVMPLPAALNTLLELMARTGSSAAVQGGIGLQERAHLGAAPEVSTVASGEQAVRGKVTPNRAALRKRGITEDGST